MADDVSFEHINTQNRYDLQQLFQNDPLSDNISDSQFHLCNNTCLCYERHAVNIVFSQTNEGFSVFFPNCQRLRVHWDSVYNLIQEMGGDRNSYDVISVTESFGRSHGECSLLIYTYYYPLEFNTRNDSPNSKGGTINIKSGLTFRYSYPMYLSLNFSN